ncbi:MAG: PEP-CTERM sorting domain-containing protein [Phenylobacterium sp.]|uniref:PEPxxWA-CTERM sorting domain-containing protein n=1 Tax=Phenylobacterium sp. TaxID=1871053 RepID=UPI001A5129BD|nr:PEPxxWA-CTERM sorting domain-containing protein [Phenylobacterium sp.]MBL8772655.1 PEP-CTERM sorting domain-containing protein [Phenylobacterium sp.]
MKKLLFAAAATLVLAGSAQAAGVTPTLDAVTPSGSNFEFIYNLTLDSDAGVRPGDGLIIYDFAGFVGFGALPNPFIEATTELTSTVSTDPDAFQPVPGFTDDPTVENLVFRWTGPLTFTEGEHPPIQFFLSAISTFSGIRSDGFTSLTVKNNGATAGQSLYAQGAVGVPVGAAIPEPGAWALMIMGFGGLGAMLRRRNSRVASLTPA